MSAHSASSSGPGLVRIGSEIASFPTSCSHPASRQRCTARAGSPRCSAVRTARCATCSACSSGIPSRRLLANARARARPTASGSAVDAPAVLAARQERHAVPALVLGRVEAAVGRVQERVERLRAVGCEGAPDRDRQLDADVPVHDRGLVDGEAEALGALGELGVRCHAGQEHRELLAAPAGQAVSGLEAGAESLRQADEDGVADGVPVGVVDLLEVVGVEEQEAAAPGRRRQGLGGDLREAAPVERRRELVGAGAELGCGAGQLELTVGTLHLVHASLSSSSRRRRSVTSETIPLTSNDPSGRLRQAARS